MKYAALVRKTVFIGVWLYITATVSIISYREGYVKGMDRATEIFRYFHK